MDVEVIRQRLHGYIEIATDKKVKALYTILMSNIEKSAVKYNENLEKELDSRYKDYETGKGNLITKKESRRIQKILKSKGKKKANQRQLKSRNRENERL